MLTTSKVFAGYSSFQLGTELSVPDYFFFLIFAFFSCFTMETGILTPKTCSKNTAEILLFIAKHICVCLCILIIQISHHNAKSTSRTTS